MIPFNSYCLTNNAIGVLMKALNFFLLLLFLSPILFIGCDEEECDCVTPPTDDRIPFEINFLEYSDNNYFIDGVYADTSAELNIYNLFYGNIPSIILTKYWVKEYEVYISVNQVGQSSIYACAYIDLPPRSESSKYPDSLRINFFPIAGKEEVGRFRLLSEGRDYLINNVTGYITFLSPLNQQDIVAIAYKIEGEAGQNDDLCYGEFFSDLINNSDTIGVLKLIKPRNLIPQYETAWKLKMRNLYQITPYISHIKNIDLDIYLKKADGSESNMINSVRLLELFGFDKMKETGEPGSDGKFDNRTGYTFNPITSEIIFPVIQPFGNNIPSQLSEYKYQAIYDTVKTYLSLPDNHFIIKGKYEPI